MNGGWRGGTKDKVVNESRLSEDEVDELVME